MTLTQDQVNFLARLWKSPEGQFLVSMYEAELSELDVKLRRATGEVFSQTQGRAQQLEEMVKRIKGETTAKSRPFTPVKASQWSETQ